MAPFPQELATAAFRSQSSAQPPLSTPRTALARISLTPPPRHGSGTAAAPAKTTALQETSSSIRALAPLTLSASLTSAASPSLSTRARSRSSPAQTTPRDRDANAHSALTPLLTRPSTSAAATELTTWSEATSSSALIPAYATETVAHALAAFLSRSCRLRSLARAASPRATTPLLSSAIASPSTSLRMEPAALSTAATAPTPSSSSPEQ